MNAHKSDLQELSARQLLARRRAAAARLEAAPAHRAA